MALATLALVAALAGAATPSRPAADLEKAGFAALAGHRYAEALGLFDRLAASDPEQAAAHLGRGMALAGLLNYAGAAAALERAVRLDPDSAVAWRELVILDSQIGKKAEAREAYRRVRALGEIPVEQKLPVAQALRKAGWTAEARDLLLELPEGARSDEENLELGLIAMGEADYAGAVAPLQQATRNPRTSDAEAEYQLGRALEALGRRDQALVHYRLAHQKDPRHRSARFRLGMLLLRTGHTREGELLLRDYETYRLWDRRVKLLLFMVASGKLGEAEQRQKSLQLVGLLLQGGDLERVGPVIRQALAAHPDDPDFLTAEARWLLARGQPGKAREILAPVLKAPQPPPDALWLSARLDLLARRVRPALHTYETLLARDADPPARLLEEAAAAYALADRPAEAEAIFRRAIGKDPRLPESHMGLGLLLQTEGQLPEAEAELRRALDLEPDRPSAQKALGSLLLQKGDAAGAAALLASGVEAHPKDAGLRLTLAQALDRLGRKDEAEAQRRTAEQLLAERPQP